MMVGTKLEAFYTFSKRTYGKTALEVRHVTRNGVLNDIRFSICAGEVLSFGGIVGAGRSELMRSIVGIDPMDSGEVYICGKKLSKPSPRAAEADGWINID